MINPCNFGSLENNLLKIQIVLEIHNRDTLERLLEDDMLIDEMIKSCQSVEAAERNWRIRIARPSTSKSKFTIHNCTSCDTTPSINKCPAYINLLMNVNF